MGGNETGWVERMELQITGVKQVFLKLGAARDLRGSSESGELEGKLELETRHGASSTQQWISKDVEVNGG